jgi:hypothetical protein
VWRIREEEEEGEKEEGSAGLVGAAGRAMETCDMTYRASTL